MKKKLTFGLLLVLTAFFITAASRSDIFFEIKKNFSIFSDVFTEVSLRYVDEVEPGSLIRTAITAMLEMLDPYTVLIDETKNQEIDIITTGKYAGVGLEIGVQRGEIVVIAPIEGYSAQRKGVKAGDTILEINGINISDLNEQAIEALLFGEPGSTVVLKVKRFGITAPLEFVLERERIDIKSVPYAGFLDEENGIAYLQLTQFTQNCAVEVREALTRLNEQKALQSLVLDLRNNPGGLLDEAVAILDLFLPAGVEVVRIKGRLQENNQTFFTREPAVFPNLKLIVLQNGGSASASEIVAGALQDLDRALIIGERSYGKGLVQTIRPISYNNALKITTSRYYIPSGRSIQSLQYCHLSRNEVQSIPDSLRKPFKTLGGRIVYDGIGIEPDVEIKERELSIPEIALLKDSHYFYFANEYVASHDTITTELVKNEVYQAFKTYLEKEKFQFETEADVTLKRLKKSMDWGSDEQRLLTELQNRINQHKQAQLDSVKDFIQAQLYQELASRFMNKKSLYPILLTRDVSVKNALALFNNEQVFQSYLKPRN